MHHLVQKYLRGEIVISEGPESKALSKAISLEVEAGRLKRIAPKVYTTSMAMSDADVIKRNVYAVLGALYPGAIISHRSALEGGHKDGHIVLTYSYTKNIKLPGLTVHLYKGNLEEFEVNRFVGNLLMSTPERAWLENSEISSGSTFKKIVPKEQLERDLENFIIKHGEAEFKDRINAVHRISDKLEMNQACQRFQKIAGALLGTRPVSNLSSNVAIARSQGFPFDVERVQLFQTLYTRLKDSSKPGFFHQALGIRDPVFITNICFFDSYFSNYIEGTQFEIDEAREIVFDNKIPAHRPEGHDLGAAFQILLQLATQEFEAFQSADQFIAWIQQTHKLLMGQHPSKNPGLFKTQPNTAGGTRFVLPELVVGTLKQAFEYYPSLDDGYAKALYLKFVIAEIHPFDDGNGRMSRIILNRELYRAGLWPIIVPTVLRNEYLDSLRKLTRSQNPELFMRVMRIAANFVQNIDFSSFEIANAQLSKANAYLEKSDSVGLDLGAVT